MNVQVTIPRSARRWQLVVPAVVVAAGVAAAIFVFATSTGTQKAHPRFPASAPARSSPVPLPAHAANPIMSLTPARLAAGALGTSYALASAPSGPTMESVLASMTPETRRYTEAIMSLTFTQLAAGAGGHP